MKDREPSMLKRAGLEEESSMLVNIYVLKMEKLCDEFKKELILILLTDHTKPSIEEIRQQNKDDKEKGINS